MIIKFGISFLLLLFVVQAPHCQETKYEIRTVAFYNVENLFDTINNPDTFDDDFTPKGKNNYTSQVYWNKIDNISHVIAQIGFDKSGDSPAIIGLSEIENKSVLEDLIYSTSLKNKGYQIIHFDSPDRRGIDVALLYKEKYFKPINQENIEVRLWDNLGKRIFTRDILLVQGMLEEEEIFLLINHWPSRRGGLIKSNPRREKTAFVNQQIIDKIRLENRYAKIIIMGDFNDNPVDNSIKIGLKSIANLDNINSNEFYNPMEKMYKNGCNTLGYRDKLYLFDQILLSAAWGGKKRDYLQYTFYKAGIYNPNYLITERGRYKGYPLRSFENNHYRQGYSDHFPVYVYFIKKN